MEASSPIPATLRIFIASPGDVADERDKAKQVIDQLQNWYGDLVHLIPVLWEELPLELDSSFQTGIDVILRRSPIDIAVFILWCRLGSPLGKSVLDREGKPYRSGTEREFDLMLEALKQSGGKRPNILFYRREDDPAFKKRLATENDRNEIRELLNQSELAQSFVQEHFQDEEGHNTRAYHRFHQPVEFASRLKVHLRALIDKHIEAREGQREARWTEAPYRGLEAFHFRHSDIFFGREAEICDLETRLRQREREGCAFVAVVGASGSGKSSLVRAGLQASLIRFNLDETVRRWRGAVLLPTQNDSQPLSALVRAMITGERALPELGQSGLTETEIAETLAESPAIAMRAIVKPALGRAGEKVGGSVKLLLVIDQFEELFTDKRISGEDRDRFLLVLETLAQSGFCWVVVTLRSDFYSVAQKNEIFLRLKSSRLGETGQFDLLAPGPEALRRIITEPARMAGLRFERRSAELGGQSLVGKILEDAKGQPDMLPLLSDLLLELYQLRTKENLITFAAYESLGDEQRTGLEGALSQRAEKEFAKLTPEQQSTCPEILHALVTVEADADVRRRANLAALKDTPQKAALVDAFVEARLLTADGPTVSLSHEALLRKWDRIADWVRDNRQFLRIRSRVEQALRRWSDAGNRPDLFLNEGLDLEEGLSLVIDAPHLIAGSEYESLRPYVLCSRDHHKERRRLEEERRQELIDDARRNEGIGLVFRAEIAEERGKRYPDTLFHAARAIGFLGKGRKDVGEPALEKEDGFPILLHPDRDAKHHERARRWIEDRPAYLPVWRSLSGKSPVTGLAWSPDGRVLGRSFADGSVKIWDWPTDRDISLCSSEGQAVHGLVLSPDYRTWVAGGAEGTVRRWDAQTLKELKPLKLHDGAVTAVAFSPDGRWLASAALDGTVRLWNLLVDASGPQLLRHLGPSHAVAFSPDNAVFASASVDGHVIIRDVVNASERITLEEPGTAFLGLAFSPNGRLLAGTGDDGRTRLWDISDGKRIQILAAPNRIQSPQLTTYPTVFRPDGTVLACGLPQGGIQLWNLGGTGDPQLMATLTGGGAALAFAPGGGLLAEGARDGTVRLWDTSGVAAEPTKGPDLCAYFREGWYRFDEDQEVVWHSGQKEPMTAYSLSNLRIDSLIGIWRNASVDDCQRWRGLFEQFLAARDWACALFLVEHLRGTRCALPEFAAKLGAALASEASEAQSAYAWKMARWRLEQLLRLDGDLPVDIEVEILRLQENMISPNSPRNFTNEENMALIWCPPGSAFMSDGGRLREVNLTSGYWIGKTPVTQELWQRVMGNTPSEFSSTCMQSPVEQVSWKDAMVFCQNLNARERAKGAVPDDWEYGLPTEAQWEYACRAGSKTAFCFGEEEDRLSDYGWYCGNSGQTTHPVGQKKPNAWGIHDMHGNVWEWVSGHYVDYEHEAATGARGLAEGADRVFRGGCWSNGAPLCRSASRSGLEQSYRSNCLGFRVALLLSAQSQASEEQPKV